MYVLMRGPNQFQLLMTINTALAAARKRADPSITVSIKQALMVPLFLSLTLSISVPVEQTQISLPFSLSLGL